ncbi:MAG: aminotransferase class I/II-fold pyridoxal phosphate-dependent enzyme [Deltaproteobacteria bacterium]|nr:aminotransferase class I/II-fold pyridoxal phosphate-dependent enzyme [Deltaproteobacteria bacterium]
MEKKNIPNLTAQIKDNLIQQVLKQRQRQAEQEDGRYGGIESRSTVSPDIPEQYYHFHLHPGYQQLRIIKEGAVRLGIDNPFFKLHDGTAGSRTIIGGKEFNNFTSYNYLGLSGHPEVSEAAKSAIDLYGTSVSASRLVSGERPIHRKLEDAIARAYAVEDAVVFVSGHAANVSTIGYLFGHNDLILHDELIHNSVLQGIKLSGARRIPFPHNDYKYLHEKLKDQRRDFERVLIVLEGIYSMEGDFPDLPRFVEIKNMHRAFLMVDEAHSFGVMGNTGMGIREHFGLDGSAVDIWMGTLSKTLAGCGGYIAGETALVEHLRFLAPGFLYSVGMSPPVAAASLAAMEILKREPGRVKTLQSRSLLFLELARSIGINTGTCAGFAVIPVIIGNSMKAACFSAALFRRNINVQPIIFPAVPEKSARLRFFISCEHGESQIEETIKAIKEEAKLLPL